MEADGVAVLLGDGVKVSPGELLAVMGGVVDDEGEGVAGADMDGEGEETLADLGDYAKSIVKSKDETITINGKQYRAIKEEKKKYNPRILKENYDRIFRSLK